MLTKQELDAAINTIRHNQDTEDATSAAAQIRAGFEQLRLELGRREHSADTAWNLARKYAAELDALRLRDHR